MPIIAISPELLTNLSQTPEALSCNCNTIQTSLEYAGIQVAYVLCKSEDYPVASQ